MTLVRPYRPADEAPLFKLVRAFPTPTPPDRAAFAAALRAKLADEASYLAVAEHDGALVGYIAGYCHPTFYASGYTAWVDEVLVDAAFRKLGVGRQLMDACEAWAARRECTLVALATRAAGPFYERLGYASRAEYFKKYLKP
jgi:GNAT superfamily N-acetyltransferase